MDVENELQRKGQHNLQRNYLSPYNRMQSSITNQVSPYHRCTESKPRASIFFPLHARASNGFCINIFIDGTHIEVLGENLSSRSINV